MHDEFTQAVHANINRYLENEIHGLLQKQPSNAALYDCAGGFINLCEGLYNPEELGFLTDMARKFPRVRLGFFYFALLKAAQRPLAALRLVEIQPRAGWYRIGVPMEYIQSVGQHQRAGYLLANLLFSDHPKLKLIQQVFRYHDCGEAVIGDFTPHCSITKTEKLQLEILAVRLMTSAARHGDALSKIFASSFAIFEGQVAEHADVALKTCNIDLLEMSTETRFLRHKTSRQKRAALEDHLVNYDNYVEERLTDPRVRAFFWSVREAAENQPLTHVWLRAMQSVLDIDKAYAVTCSPILNRIMNEQGLKV